MLPELVSDPKATGALGVLLREVLQSCAHRCHSWEDWTVGTSQEAQARNGPSSNNPPPPPPWAVWQRKQTDHLLWGLNLKRSGEGV